MKKFIIFIDKHITKNDRLFTIGVYPEIDALYIQKQDSSDIISRYIKDISEQSAAKKDSVATVKPIVAPKVEIKKEEVKPPVVTTASVAPEIKKKDSIVETPVVASHSISITAKEVKDTDKKSPKDQVVIAKKDDESSSAKSTHTKPDSVKKTPVDTAAVAKKKKKKKKASDVTEEIRQSTQQPNSSDDDVVVPNN